MIQAVDAQSRFEYIRPSTSTTRVDCPSTSSSNPTIVVISLNDSPRPSISVGPVVINQLPTKKLSRPLSAILERDGDGYLARLVDLPLYGYDDDGIGAIENLKAEIESLYNDLMEDNNFSPEWLSHKEFLKSIISE